MTQVVEMTRLGEVARKLIERTNQGAVEGAPVRLEQTLQAEFGKVTVIISQDVVRKNLAVHRLAVLNEEGRTADALSTFDAAPQTVGALEELYYAARNASRKTDKTLTELLAILDAEG